MYIPAITYISTLCLWTVYVQAQNSLAPKRSCFGLLGSVGTNIAEKCYNVLLKISSGFMLMQTIITNVKMPPQTVVSRLVCLHSVAKTWMENLPSY